MRAHVSVPTFAVAASIASLLVSCGPPSINYVTAAASPIQAPVIPVAPAQPPTREKLAVLPIEDEKLFRSERALLRFELHGHLARLLPDRIIVPSAEVDAKIRPVSESTGHLCAYEGEPIERRVQHRGWQFTRMLHVSGLEKGPGEELWVEIVNGLSTVTTLHGPWNSNVPRIDAYRGAFAAFVKNDALGLLGGLGASGNYENALRDGAVTVCETKFFGSCEKSSVDWQDRVGAVAACFSGVDESTRDLLVQGDVGPYCEMENLDYPDGRDARLEACLCKTLGTSSAMAKRPGRRTIRVHYEAPDLQGKPRPEVRVVETTTNMDSEDAWHSMQSTVDGKKQYHSIRRLVVDNLDALAAPLSRCAIPRGTVSIADIEVREDGAVLGSKLVTSALDSSTQTCIEQALSRGAFNCTDDGKSARIRVAMEWKAQ